VRVLGYDIIEKAGMVLKHALGVLLLCWRRMARAGLVSGVVGFILVEIVGSIMQQKFPTSILTTVVALIFALLIAYGVMLTVLIDELIIGSIDIVRVLQGEVGAGARAIAMATERRAGESGSGIMRWLGVRPSRSSADMAITSLAPGLVFPDIDAPYSAEDQWNQTQADIEATDEFLSTAPRPRVNARPVQATQLPRIEWALEQMEQREQATLTPVRDWPQALPADPVAPVSAATETAATELPPVIPRVTRPITRPLSSELVLDRPAAGGGSTSDAGGADNSGSSDTTTGSGRGIWSRISKTLVGTVHPPLGDEAEGNQEV
jgi:hypothetical protein